MDIEYIGPVRDAAEEAAAKRLAASVFGSIARLSEAEATDHKDFLWRDPHAESGHVILAVSAKGDVAGLTRLIPRVLNRADGPLPVAGISSVCVARDARGRGVSARIMDVALAEARSMGCRATFLFARRAVDHFYPKFGIWGLASYSQISIRRTDGPPGFPIRLRPAEETDLHLLDRWYRRCYVRVFGAVERSELLWRFYLEKARRQSTDLQILLVDDEPIGYFAAEANRVIELAFSESADVDAVLAALPSESDELVLQMSPDHAVVDALSRADITMTRRQCEYGGHMMGVLDRDWCATALARSIQRRAADIGLKPMEERYGEIVLRWDGKQASVSVSDNAILGLTATARLLGIRTLTSAPSLLAPGAWLDIPNLDHL